LHGAPSFGRQPGSGVRAACSRPAGKHNAGASVGEGSGDCQAQSRRAPGDQRYLPGPGPLRRHRDIKMMITIGLISHGRMIPEPSHGASDPVGEI
jgi:hypothetical protein